MLRPLSGHLQVIKMHKIKTTDLSPWVLQYICQYKILKPIKYMTSNLTSLRGLQPIISFSEDFCFFWAAFVSRRPQRMWLVYCVVCGNTLGSYFNYYVSVFWS